MHRQGRRHFLQGSLALAGLGLLSGCGIGSHSPQGPARPRRIGFLVPSGTPPQVEGFREGLRDLGYVEGQNILIEYRDAEGDVERLPALAAELVRVPVEVIVSPSTLSLAAASRAAPTIPIVAAGGNVVGAGLVTSMARPEGNLTGVASNSVETVGKWVELLKATVPTISRLAALLDLSNVTAQPFVQQVQRAAQTLQLELTTYDLRDLDQLPSVLSRVRGEGADGLVVVPGGALGGVTDPRIGGEVLKSRLPAVAEPRAFALAGGLLAHGPDLIALARRSASYVDKLLKGARPADLPIELPTTFHIVVNLRTAEGLGIAVPQSVLLQASETIQ